MSAVPQSCRSPLNSNAHRNIKVHLTLSTHTHTHAQTHLSLGLHLHLIPVERQGPAPSLTLAGANLKATQIDSFTGFTILRHIVTYFAGDRKVNGGVPFDFAKKNQLHPQKRQLRFPCCANQLQNCPRLKSARDVNTNHVRLPTPNFRGFRTEPSRAFV